MFSVLSGEDADISDAEISALDGEEVLPSFSGGGGGGEDQDDEEEAATTTGFTIVSTTSSNASNYFSHHKQADSLCYSSASSCDFPYPISSGRGKGVPNSSYLASFGNSLSFQQAFPSSMFPLQKLLPPNHPRKQQLEQHTHQYSSSNTSSSSQQDNNCGMKMVRSVLPPYQYLSSNATALEWLAPGSSYQNSTGGSYTSTASTKNNNFNGAAFGNAVGSNVYQNRQRQSAYHDDDVEMSLPANWRAALKCFFTPRVLLTVMLSAVVLFNLLKYGSKYHSTKNLIGSEIDKNSSDSSTLRGGRSSTIDYIKLQTIGNTGSRTTPWNDDDSPVRSKRGSNNDTENINNNLIDTVPKATPVGSVVAGEEASKESSNDGVRI